MGGSRDEVVAALARAARGGGGDGEACAGRFTEWTMIDGDLVCRYVWHNLPDPTGGTARYTLPGTEILRRVGDGDRFETVGEFRNGDDADAMTARWHAAGGDAAVAAGPELRGIIGWAPEPLPGAAPREEIERAFGDFASRLAEAAAGGEWAPVAAVFTDEVRVRDHVSGFVEGRHALSAWIQDGVKRSPFKRYDVRLRIVDGNRVSTVLRAEGPTGGLDVNLVLHYAREGRWSYVEVVYNPQEVRRLGT
ncbi:nuclear transport factor 2 family protein [Embleya sp. NBC_00896]|uniref:nuclear transport factor 2 family protein n=1 Tax=Embleya sp. NBC_00896 TaxID=2975961 RepID=UPI003866F18B|nr:nuclear transport factor 2 family protein [Embleya sp. NBC_00896]